MEGDQSMECIKMISERRSINFFDSEKELAESKIKELLELANLAPSSMNLQPWKVIAVKSKERKKALRKCAFNQPKIEEAQVVFIIIGDPGTLEKNIDRCLKSWVDLGYIKLEASAGYKKNAVSMYGEEKSEARKIFTVKNSSLFAMNLMLSARALGLESHPMDGFDLASVKKEFQISEDSNIPMLVAVGYPKKDLKILPRAFRREFEEYVRVC